MALQSFGVGDALTAKLWSQGLNAEVLKKTYVGKFGHKGSDSLMQVLDKTSKTNGDNITYGLRMQLAGEGVTSNAGLEGNEEAWTRYSDSLTIEQLRHATRFYSRIDQQRVPFSLRQEAKLALSDWWSGRLDEIFFNHLCGYTPATANTRDGHNTIVAPGAASVADTDHHMVCEAGSTTDEALDSTGDTFDVNWLDIAAEKAKTISPALRPFRYDGKEYFVCFVHPYQVTSLRNSSSQWFAQMTAAMQGGYVNDNPIFTGALGVHNGIVLHESSRVTQGVNSTTGAAISTVRRAVLCGAQALVMSYGREGGRMERYMWDEETFNYGNEVGFAASLIFGMKAVRFNSKDFGKIVISSYATAS